MSSSMPSADLLGDRSEHTMDYPRLQDGIYFRKYQRPSPYYRLLLLNVKAGATSGQARAAIAAVWEMVQGLRRGVVQELRPTRDADPAILVPAGDLTCLLGFGVRLFDHDPTLTPHGVRPAELIHLGYNGDQPFPSLLWVEEAERRSGEADLALQFIAETELAVNRAVVEVCMLINDKDNPLPLDIVTFYNGFNRDDRRSWIGFQDGISNIEPSQRRTAIEVALNNPVWMAGGTYMAFLRLAIDLAKWRGLSREHQEILVGRDKLTGYPLEKVTRLGQAPVPVPVAGCPMFSNPPPQYINPPPPPVTESLLRTSHIHRANPNRNIADSDEDNRIFRQGYEFLESVTDGGLRVGLNFVSYQRSLNRLTNILNIPGWLGNVNFGGPVSPQLGEPRPISFLSIIAGGFYAVPPKADPTQGEEFPGAGIFV
jgi:Dyp-type peroxidase family